MVDLAANDGSGAWSFVVLSISGAMIFYHVFFDA
jgi:hypothetical protein